MYCQNLNCSEEYLKIDSTVTQEMYQLVDGIWITKSQLDSIFQRAWDNSFGKMTEEENELLFGGSTIFLGVQPGKLEDE
jgi:hypothetical protein